MTGSGIANMEERIMQLKEDYFTIEGLLERVAEGKPKTSAMY